MKFIHALLSLALLAQAFAAETEVHRLNEEEARRERHDQAPVRSLYKKKDKTSSNQGPVRSVRQDTVHRSQEHRATARASYAERHLIAGYWNRNRKNRGGSSSGGKGKGGGSKGSKGSGSKGSKGSKGGSKGGSGSSSGDYKFPWDKKWRKRDKDKGCDGDDCGDCDGDCCGDDCGGGDFCTDCCFLDIYEFFGDTERLTVMLDGTRNEIGTTYKLDNNIYVPDGNLDQKLTDPQVQVVAKCTQIRRGRVCDEDINQCCRGCTICDFIFTIEDSFGEIGQFSALGNLIDNTLNSIPITGGTGALEGATGEVLMEAFYIDGDADDPDCPFIDSVDFYAVSASVVVEVCDFEAVFVDFGNSS